MFWLIFPDLEEWAEPDQLPTHNLLLKLFTSISKEPVVIVQANVNLIASYLNIMTCTDICSCLQSFLAVFCVPTLCVQYCVLHQLYFQCTTIMCLHVLNDSTRSLPPTWSSLDLRSAYYSLSVQPHVCIAVN